MMKTIAYASLTGNTKRFMGDVKKLRPDWHLIQIKPDTKIDEKFHLVTYTTGLGEIPPVVVKFLEKNSKEMLSVSACGNMNWGKNFAIAADKVSEKYNVPVLLKYELAGNQKTAEQLINKIEEF